MTIDEGSVIQHAQSGEQKAFIQLMQSYESEIEQIVQKQVDNIAGHDHESLTDEILKGVWKALPEFSDEYVTFKAWLQHTARVICEELQSADDLLERAKKGDYEALAKLIACYDPVIRHIIRKYQRKIYGHEEDDLVQEVIIKAYGKICEFRKNAGAFKSYVCKIAKYLCLDILDGYNRHPYPASLEELTAQAKDWVDEIVASSKQVQSPLEKLLGDELETCIEQTVNALPETMREVVILRFKMDMKYKEIAKSLNRKINTVKIQLKRAMEEIQEQCGE